MRWYKPEEKLPEEGLIVLATVSGKRSTNITYDHALALAEWYDDGDGWSLTDINPDEFVVHAWMEVAPYAE